MRGPDVPPEDGPGGCLQVAPVHSASVGLNPSAGTHSHTITAASSRNHREARALARYGSCAGLCFPVEAAMGMAFPSRGTGAVIPPSRDTVPFSWEEIAIGHYHRRGKR